MKKSESIVNLAKALPVVQSKLRGALKDSSNPFFKSKYADLESVWDSCRKELTDNGFSVVQTMGFSESAGATLETTLLHSSGEWISGESPIYAKNQNPQDMGSAITYSRRYGLAAIVGVVQVDDDAESAMGRAQNNNNVAGKTLAKNESLKGRMNENRQAEPPKNGGGEFKKETGMPGTVKDHGPTPFDDLPSDPLQPGSVGANATKEAGSSAKDKTGHSSNNDSASVSGQRSAGSGEPNPGNGPRGNGSGGSANENNQGRPGAASSAVGNAKAGSPSEEALADCAVYSHDVKLFLGRMKTLTELKDFWKMESKNIDSLPEPFRSDCIKAKDETKKRL